MTDPDITVSDWIKGIGFSVLASVIGASSKLAIRKSWLMEEESSFSSSISHASNHSNSDSRIRRTDGIEEGGSSVGSSVSGDGLAWGDTRRWPRTLRCLGFLGMTFLNPACSVTAMNYASPSILAPFSGLTLVWVILFSQPVVGETPTLRQVVACACILTGEVIVALFGDHTNDEGVTIEDVVRSYKKRC